MDMVYRSGSTELSTKDTGSKIKLKVKELSGMLKVIYMLESSRRIRLVGLVFTLT